MKRILKISAVIFLVAVIMSLTVSAAVIDSSEDYTYDNSQKPMTAPLSHNLEEIVTGESIAVDTLSDIADIAVHGNKLYILEKSQGKIFVLNSDCELDCIIGEGLGLNQPEGFFISNEGYIYIADTQNQRILKLDNSGKLLSEIKAPDKKKTLSTVDFYPSKLVVDEGERLYIIVNNETSGIYQMDINGNFLGFFGSVPVVPSITELMWRAVSTKEQLSRMLLFIPTEYSSMAIDSDGFIYTTVATNTDSEIYSYIKSKGSDSTLAPIRKLNPKNIDVLKRTGSMPPAGDLIENSSDSSDSVNASRFIDISVRDDGCYCALDSTRSRIFTYDESGNLLYIFGNTGDTADTFINPNSVCWWGDRVVVSDIGNSAVKIFAPTEYASLIDKAIKTEMSGDYEASEDCWKALLSLHSGSNLAFVGLGKIEMRSGNYKAAMDWFEKADSAEYYSKAMKLYRKEIGMTVTGLAISVAVLGALAIIIIKKYLTKKKAQTPKIKRPVLEGVKYGFYIMRHPFDGFWDMQHEGRGNLRSATVIFSAVVLLNLISTFSTGYLVSGKRGSDFNVLVSGILGVVIPFALWCVANWSVTSLMNGSGTFKNIYMYSCYSLTPLLIGMPVIIILSNILTLEETALYSIISTLFYIWVGFLLFVGTLVVHQYLALRTVATIVVIIVAMGIIIFLFLLCVTIAQQMTDFLSLLFEEINLRM